METADLQVKIPNSRLKKIKERFGDVPKHIWFLSALLIVSLIALAILYPALLSELTQKTLEPEDVSTSTESPTEPPITPLAQGRQIYNISGGTKGGPQMTQVFIDPLDPKPSQIQTLTLKANNLKPIVEIKAIVITDNKNEESANILKLISGTNVDGVWQGSWRIRSEHNYNYQIKLVAKNNEDIESIVTLTFR